MRYAPSLDGLRAVAIAGVVAYHATGYPAAGWLGVDLFFVLSGFLITTLLVREHRENGRVSFRGFYRRRALRLLPALLAMLAVVLAVERDFVPVLIGGAYLTNFVMADAPGATPEELEHLWSLAAEEQFYLLWPLVLFGLIAGRVRGGLLVASAGAVLATLWAFTLCVNGASWQRIAFAPDSRGVGILVGCALALYLVQRPRRVRALELPALALIVSLTFVRVDGTDLERLMLSGIPILLFAVACAVLIVRALDDASAVSAILAIAPLVFLGRISYALYLWHVPIMSWVGAEPTRASMASAVAIGLSLVAATLSYYLVELPFLRRKHWQGRSRTDAITAPATA